MPGYHKRAFFLFWKFVALIHGSRCAPFPLRGCFAVIVVVSVNNNTDGIKAEALPLIQAITLIYTLCGLLKILYIRTMLFICQRGVYL